MTDDELRALIERLRGHNPTAVTASRDGEHPGRVAYCYGYHQALSDIERELGPFARYRTQAEETPDVDP